MADVRLSVDWAMEEVLGTSRAMLYAHPQRAVAPHDAERVLAMTRRRAGGEPIQYVVGHAAFYGLRLRVTPDVLIPRPETEEVVERGLRLIRDVKAPRVLDVGTGSGCIALAIKHERPDADVGACDLSEAALRVAAANAAALGLDVRFFRANLLAPDFAARVPGGLDLLISNPPYVPDAEAATLAPEVAEHEPPLALFTGSDPLVFYRALARHASDVLVPGRLLLCETHMDYALDVRRLLADAGLRDAATARDLAGRPRMAWGRR